MSDRNIATGPRFQQIYWPLTAMHDVTGLLRKFYVGHMTALTPPRSAPDSR